MTTLIQLAAAIGALALVVGSFRYVFDPRGATAMLKTVAFRLLAIVFGAAVLEKFIEELPQGHSDGGALIGLVLLSLIAFVIRELRMRNVRKPLDVSRIRGTERTPVLPHHMEDNE